MKPYTFGVDIGGTTVKIGFFTSDGQLLKKWEIPTSTENNGASVLPDIAASLSSFLEDKSIEPDEIEGIGIAVPGPVNMKGIVNRCVNLGWGVVNLREEMNRLLPEIPNVRAGNDANAAALGEFWQGGGKGHESAILITLGTGVGGGVVEDGHIIAGKNGGAGEIGHMTVEPSETQICTCGKYGCLEQYASANGIVRLAHRMLKESDKPSALRSMASFTSREICDLARDHEPMAESILDRCSYYLGLALSYAACTADPDVIILGGGMSAAGEILTSRIQKYYSHYVFHASAHTPIVLARLGNDAGIYGSARMVL